MLRIVLYFIKNFILYSFVFGLCMLAIMLCFAQQLESLFGMIDDGFYGEAIMIAAPFVALIVSIFKTKKEKD